jgi:hypothetical protein
MMCDPSNRSTDVWLRRASDLTTSVTRFGRFLRGFVRRSWFPLRDPDEFGTMRRTAVLTTWCHNSSSVIVCPKQQCTARSLRFILGVLRAGLFLNMGYCISVPVLVAMPSTGVTVRGPGVPPNLGFACCDQGIEEMQALFNHQDVIANLKDLHAEVAIPILDFSPERAAAIEPNFGELATLRSHPWRLFTTLLWRAVPAPMCRSQVHTSPQRGAR